ncbi:alpha-amylase MalA [Halarchaeum nitratireducens]|uniref:alpha-amylase MalA n=1 Tax=Halarchaeum nitratireducens TaxID=489913 RepID=UPI001668390E|nr:alpha-amylase MalA [Halarchaeum nitratireducens]
MHHPGPPRFVSVGDRVELAPRDPDPAATYAWRIERAPAGSDAAVDDRPVQWFHPDVPGRYVLTLDAPDGVHRQTIRCFDVGGETDAGGERDARGSGGALDVAAEGDAGTSGYGHDATGGGDRGGGRPRVHLDGRVAGDSVVIEADARTNPAGGGSAASLDVTFAFDDRDDLRAADASADGRRLRIPLARLPERARVHAVAVSETGYSVPDAVDIVRDDAAPGGVAVRRPYDPPAWATDAVYYEVYLRTFAPEAEHGGTFRAIADRLDHLADLGVDVLWLTPVLAADHAPHGYNITDFFSLAADLGDREDYRHLVERAHDHGMRVLFDLVLNHSARDHPYFRDAYRNPESDYRDWYEWQPSGEPGTYFDWEHIANFDFETLDVRRHLLDAVDTWAPLVDGFRCDMAWAVPDGFWREVHDRVKARDAEFLLLDETIPYIPDFQAGLFDVHFDSTTYAALRSVGTGWAPASALLDAIEERSAIGFPDHARFLLYAENHDETRYRVECGRPAALAAAGALCTLPGAPLVYAGQETGQLGRRDALVWDATDDALTDHYRRLLSLRRTMPALAADAALERIDYTVREGDPERVVAFGRANGGRGSDPERDAGAGGGESAADEAGVTGDERDAAAAVVVCNFAAEPVTVDLGVPTGARDAATGETVAASGGVRVDSVAVLPTSPDAFDGGA